MKFILIVLSTVLCFESYGKDSGRVGNGGGVLFCENREPILLDFYEAEFIEAYRYENIRNLPALEIRETLHRRINFFNPEVASLLEHLSIFFDERVTYVDDAKFKIPDDFLNLYYEDICELKVLAVQRKPIMSFDKIFFINKVLWSKVNSMTKVGLKSHELLYFVTLTLGQKNSKSVRRALSYILSDEFTHNKEKFKEKFLNEIFINSSQNEFIKLKINKICKKLKGYGHACTFN